MQESNRNLGGPAGAAGVSPLAKLLAGTRVAISAGPFSAVLGQPENDDELSRLAKQFFRQRLQQQSAGGEAGERTPKNPAVITPAGGANADAAGMEGGVPISLTPPFAHDIASRGLSELGPDQTAALRDLIFSRRF